MTPQRPSHLAWERAHRRRYLLDRQSGISKPANLSGLGLIPLAAPRHPSPQQVHARIVARSV